MKRLDIPSLVSFARFQDDPRPLSHFKVIARINEHRFLECGFADFVMGNPGEEFVATVGLDDFEAEVVHSHLLTFSRQLGQPDGNEALGSFV